MSSFSFLSQYAVRWLLVGLVAAAIPVLIHLSRSRRTKKMRFSTTRFFTDQFLRSYRMSRLKEIVLLLFRMALFALLAIALAQPFFAPPGTVAAGGAGGGPRSAILILDDSASMGLAEGDITLFAKAQKSANSILASLSSGDTASVILAGRRATGPEVLFPEPTPDLDDVKAAIAKRQVATLGTDLGAALTRAEELAILARAARRSVTVYVLSDLQESGWDAPTSDTARSDNKDISYVFVGLRPTKTPNNRAVTAVRYAATRPRVGMPFALRPLLSLGKDDTKDATVKLFIDGAKVGEQKVERLPGNKWASPRFYHTFADAGWHGGTIEIDDESLAADNKRFFTLEIPEQTQTVSLLAVNGAPSSVAHQDELFFLRFALTAAPEGQKAPFDIHAIAPSEVAATEVKNYPLVVLANVAELSEAAVEKLEDYLDGGGKLLVFLGDRVSPEFYNRVLAGANRRHGGLLPATIRGLVPKDAGHIASIQYEHRALAAFQEPKLGSLLGPGLTFKALELDAPPQSVLMKSSIGLPLLCDKAFGKGEVVLFASTCDRDWSDFPIRPGFLVWSRSLAEYLTQSALSLQSGNRTGDIVRLSAPADEKGVLWVKKPDGTRAAASRANDGSGAFEWADTVEPGVYTVLRSDQRTRVGLFAVNLDSYESDLVYLSDGPEEETAEQRRTAVIVELKSRLGQAPLVSYIDDPTMLTDALGKSRGGMKLWDIVLLVVLLIALFEPWLANQISGRLFSKAAKLLVVPGPQTARVVETPQPIAEGVR
jgi:Aerotolerance regulator N-terminal/von Willebrand factor type A domain